MRCCSLAVYTWISLVTWQLSAGAAADWPTFRGNAARTGDCDESLSFPLQKAWEIHAEAAPRLAWSSGEGRVIEGKLLEHRVRFDDAFRTVIANGRVYFGSTVDHQLHCVDLATGAPMWTFFTGGAIRLAPTVAEGRVLFGSDDGRVYCLDASTGALLWQRRVAPSDEWLLARGEMISKWPLRTGVLVHNGIAYYGAGIFPHEEVFLEGVSLATGERVWKVDNISAQDAGRNDLSPQGYLLAREDLLFVPSGRSLPAVFDLKSGRLVYKREHSWRSTAGGVVGGTRALLADGQLYTGGPQHFLAMDERTGDVGFGWFEGREMVVQGDQAYVVTGTRLARLDRQAYAVNSRRRHQLELDIENFSRSVRGAGDKEAEIREKLHAATEELKQIANIGIVWSTDTEDDRALLVTRDHVLVGGPRRVTAYHNTDGAKVWSQDLDGDARGIVAVDGGLLVSTDAGTIYRLAKSSPPAAAPTLAAKPSPPQIAPRYVSAAQEVLRNTGVKNGFCLVVGSGDGQFAQALAQQSDLKVYCAEADAAAVAKSRERLQAAGLYGHRVVVHHWDLSEIPYSNYFANLIIPQQVLDHGTLPAELAAITRHLKPVGGVLYLGRPADAGQLDRETLSSWLDAVHFEGPAQARIEQGWATLTRGALPGAGNWSHQYGNPGNTAVSEDQRVKGDLGVLWYGDPGPEDMVNRHEGAVGPLSVNGRLFVQGQWAIKAYDAYNGTHLWTFENPEAVRTGVFENQNPGNLAAGENSLFNFLGDKCYQLDMETGAVQAVHPLPPGKDDGNHQWGYVAVNSGLLIGTATVRKELEAKLRRRGRVTEDATDAIFAIDLATGKHLWTYQGKSISNQTIAIGPDKVCLIDSSITSEQREELLRQDKRELAELTGQAREIAEQRLKQADMRLAVGINSRTGEQLWAHPVDVTDCSDIGIGGGKLTMIYSDGKLVLCGANANGHFWKQFVAGEFQRRRLVVLSAEDGYKLWSKDANYRHRPIVLGGKILAEPWMFDLATGEQITRAHPITGEDVPWSIMRTGHHCGMLTGCESGMIMFRSGYTGFMDLNADEGVQHFAGHRLGCWINAIVANGLVLIPEASVGCVCQFSIESTIVLEPRESRRPWAIYSAVGAQTPVQRLAVNLGAPGDRKDALGNIWFSYPRRRAYQETSLDVKLDLAPQFVKGGEFTSVSETAVTLPGAETPWLYTSAADGLKSIKLPLLGPEDAPALYTVRLHLGDFRTEAQPTRMEVRLHGADDSRVQRLVNLARPAEGAVSPQVVVFKDIRVDRDLSIEFEAQSGQTIVNAIEAIRQE